MSTVESPIQEIEAGRAILGRRRMGRLFLAPSSRGHMPTSGASSSLVVGVSASYGLVNVDLSVPYGIVNTDLSAPYGLVNTDLSAPYGLMNAPINSSETESWVVVGFAHGTTPLTGAGRADYVNLLCHGTSEGATDHSAWSICTGAAPIADGNKSALATCSELLQSRRGLLRPHEVTALGRQLNSLLSDQDEIAESGLTVSSASLDGLIAFLAVHRPHTHLRLSLTRGGLFAASWAHHNRAKLTLTFTHEAAEWVGVDLGAVPAVRDSGAIVIGSLAGMPQPFRGWIVG